MGKLIKYELRKQLATKLIVLAILAILEVIYLFGLFTDNEGMMGLGLGFLMMTAFISMFYFGFETIITYSNDLKTKQSYMLFLVPRNAYQIVGAKVIVNVLQTVAAAAAYVAVFALDVVIICAKYGEIQRMMDGIREFVSMLTGIEVRIGDVLYLISMMLVTWLVFITLAMFAITLSTTLFANKKWKGVVSFVIYIVLNQIFGKIAELLVRDSMLADGSIIVNSAAWAYILFYILVLVLSFFGTSYLLEKKVSV